MVDDRGGQVETFGRPRLCCVRDNIGTGMCPTSTCTERQIVQRKGRIGVCNHGQGVPPHFVDRDVNAVKLAGQLILGYMNDGRVPNWAKRQPRIARVVG